MRRGIDIFIRSSVAQVHSSHAQNCRPRESMRLSKMHGWIRSLAHDLPGCRNLVSLGSGESGSKRLRWKAEVRREGVAVSCYSSLSSSLSQLLEA